MMLKAAELQSLCHVIQPMSSQFGQHSLTENQRIKPVIFKVNIVPLQNFVYHRNIEVCIMGNKYGIVTAEFHKFPYCLILCGSIGNGFIGNSCKFSYIFGNVHTRIYIGFKGIHILQILHLNSGNACQSVIFKTQSRCFNVKNNYFIVEITVIGLFQNKLTVNVIYYICLHTVNDLEILGHIIHTVGECLYTAVVGNRHSLMSPFRCP